MKKIKLFEQGDVLIFPVDSIPEGLRKTNDGVLQYGEHTGHMHRLNGDNRIMFRREDLDDAGNGPKYFSLSAECKLLHEEHNPITLPPGNYATRIIREYDHLAEEIRNVQD